jgi:hypothetical protein
VLPRWSGFRRHCEEGFFAIDKNLSEGMLRPCAIGRKNWTFVGSDRGGQTAAGLYSVVMSAKANEVEPWAYVRDVPTTLATSSSRAGSIEPDAAILRSLLPDVWQASHHDVHRRWSPKFRHSDHGNQPRHCAVRRSLTLDLAALSKN